MKPTINTARASEWCECAAIGFMLGMAILMVTRGMW